MRPPLRCILLACATIPASAAGIHPISFKHTLSAETSGSYNYINPSNGSFQNGTASTGILSFLSEVHPPLPYSGSRQAVTPPGLMAPTWSGGVIPSVVYGFAPTKWLLSTAVDGTVSALDLSFNTAFVLKGTLKPSSSSATFEFSTDSPLDVSIAGWSFLDPVSKLPIATPLNGSGKLPAGSYLVGLILTPDSTHMSFDTTSTLMVGHPLSDTDGDGLSNEEEANVRNTNPLQADSDNDGLSDFAEVRTHLTPPNDPDADDDGFLDSAEVAPGRSAFDANNVPDATLTVRQAFELRTITKLGKRYRFQSSVDMFNWIDSTTVIDGDGKDARYSIEYPDGAAKYWRLREEP